MKIQHLYTKILISFLGILFASLVLSILLFILTAGRSYKARLDLKTPAKLKIFQELIQEAIDRQPQKPVAENPDLVKKLSSFASVFDVKIWITSPDGTIRVRTFDGAPNVTQTGVHRQVHHDSGITFYHFALKWIKYYATMPLTSRHEHLMLHLYYDFRGPEHHLWLFLLGKLVIGGVAALLVIPLARFITRRVNQLNQSAIEFAGGNLACRADISGHDEIAKLGDSFNLMADKLENLLQNAKDLTANVSHELRSPLARLRLAKEMILDKVERRECLDCHACPTGRGVIPDIRRYVANMESDIQDLDTLVARMLALSKMDYQEIPLTPVHFSFNRFLDRTLAPYQSMLRQKELTLTTEIHGPVDVFQDQSVVKSILSNLLDNAVKYSGQGTILVAAARPPGADGLVFSVINPCPPLAEKALEQLFKPFFRLPGNKAPGSGLGLTIARKLARRCRGDISARNTDRGLAIEVRLPRAPKAG